MRPDRGRRRPARSPPARRCRGRRGGSARVPARRLPRDRTARGRSTCSRSHVGAPRVRAREDPTQPAQAPRRELAEHLAVQERRSRDAVHADHCIAVALLAYEAADPGGPELALGDARRSRRDCSSAPIITAPVRVRLRAVIQLAGLALAVGSTFALGFLIGPRSTDDLRATVDALGPASPLLFVGLATLLACALFPTPCWRPRADCCSAPAGEPSSRPSRERREPSRRSGSREPGAPPRLTSWPGLAPAGATAIGTAPRAFAYAALADAFAVNRPDSPEALVAIGLLIAMGLLGLLLVFRGRARPDDRDKRRGQTGRGPGHDESLAEPPVAGACQDDPDGTHGRDDSSGPKKPPIRSVSSAEVHADGVDEATE